MISQNSEKKSNRQLTEKQKQKIQKLKNAKSIYFCECQMVYLSFAALYHHAKAKHKVKLTSKVNPKVCKIVIEDGVEKITYFIQNQNPQFQQKFLNQDIYTKKIILNNDNSSSEIQPPNFYSNLSIKQVINIYLLQNQFQNNKFLSRDKVLKQFETFIENTYNYKYKENQQCPKPITFNCPLFLNSFVSLYLPSKLEKAYFQQIKEEVCSELFYFSKWLKSQKLTQFTVNYSPYWDY